MQPLSVPRTPTFDGTETIQWSNVDKTFASFISAYYTRTETTKPEEVPKQFKDCTASMRQWTSAHSMLGNPESDDFATGLVLPVVNPTTGRLNASGVRSALSYLSRVKDISETTEKTTRKKLEQLYTTYFRDATKTEGLEIIADALDAAYTTEEYSAICKFLVQDEFVAELVGETTEEDIVLKLEGIVSKIIGTKEERSIKRRVKSVISKTKYLGNIIAGHGEYHLDEIASRVVKRLKTEGEDKDESDVIENVVELAEQSKLYKQYPDICDTVWNRKLHNLEKNWTKIAKRAHGIVEEYKHIEVVIQEHGDALNKVMQSKMKDSTITIKQMIAQIETLSDNLEEMTDEYVFTVGEALLGIDKIRDGRANATNAVLTCFGSKARTDRTLVVINRETMRHMWSEY